MNIAEAITTRRSVRNYTDQQIPRLHIQQLLSAAAQAPSAMNSQPWAFSVIQDKALLKSFSDLAKSHLLTLIEDLPALEKYRGALSSEAFNIFYNASTLLTIYARPLDPHPEIDCSLAAQNVMLLAHSLGLGSCWIGFAEPLLNLPAVKKELNIPEEYSAIAPLILGYPAVLTPALPKKEPEIIFWK